MGRDPRVWPDPLEFRPERFLAASADDETKLDAQRRAAWIPFGRGSRSCIGFALAQMELTLVLARFAQRLDIEVVDGMLPKPSGMIVTLPEGGLPVLLLVH